jgi:hypothetical protein
MAQGATVPPKPVWLFAATSFKPILAKSHKNEHTRCDIPALTCDYCAHSGRGGFLFVYPGFALKGLHPGLSHRAILKSKPRYEKYHTLLFCYCQADGSESISSHTSKKAMHRLGEKLLQ